MERDRIVKRVYVREFAGSHLVGRPRKRLTDTVKGCLKKRGLDVMVEARRTKSEKLREHQYREGYIRSLEGKGVE